MSTVSVGFSVSMATASVPVPPRLSAASVAKPAATVDRAAAGEAVIGGEGRGVDQRVRQAAKPLTAVACRADVGGGEADRRPPMKVTIELLCSLLSAVDDVDGQRRVLGVDGDGIRPGAAEVERGVGVAAGGFRDSSRLPR